MANQFPKWLERQLRADVDHLGYAIRELRENPLGFGEETQRTLLTTLREAIQKKRERLSRGR